jgi:hypothetical protein
MLLGTALSLAVRVTNDVFDTLAPSEMRVKCYGANGGKIVSEWTQYEVFSQQKPELMLKAPDRYLSVFSIGMTATCVVERGYAEVQVQLPQPTPPTPGT